MANSWGGIKMNSDIKPLIEQIKTKISETNVEQLKQQVAQGVQLGRQIVTAKANDLIKQSKNSKVVNDVVIPWLESDQAKKAMETMSEKLKLKDTPIMGAISRIRQDLINIKVEKARAVEETAPPPADAPEKSQEN